MRQTLLHLVMLGVISQIFAAASPPHLSFAEIAHWYNQLAGLCDARPLNPYAVEYLLRIGAFRCSVGKPWLSRYITVILNFKVDHFNAVASRS